MDFPKKEMTIGELYEPAMEITDQMKADEYLEALIQRSIKYFGQRRGEAESIEKQNLGYFAGYYNTETRLRVERLFHCVHPIFGSASKGIPTSEEAFELGIKHGSLSKP